MRVLMLTPVVPQPTGSGAAIRTWYILQHLVHEVGASVSVLAFGDTSPTGEGEPLPDGVAVTVVAPPVRSLRRRLRVLALSGQPDLADRLWAPEVQTRLVWHTLRDDFELVYIGGLELGRYAFELFGGSEPTARPAIVLDEFNAEYRLQERAWQTDLRRPTRWPLAAYSAIQTVRLRRFERAAIRAADALVSVSEADAAALDQLVPNRPATIVPNGVDTARYRRPTPVPAGLPHFDLLFSGTLDYRPNVDAIVWFIQSVWPLLRAEWPALTLGLVGRRPAPIIRALAQQSGVIVTGPVPDDRPYLWGAGLFIVPMRYGGGSRLKLLNALAAGCPVVSTSMGAEGVTTTHGRDILIADRPEQWVRAVARLRAEPQLRQHVITGATQLVHEHYEWSVLVRTFTAVYRQALQHAHAQD